eukprot:6009236-Prymnesium_polylepis.2
MPSYPTPWTHAALRGSARRFCAKTTRFYRSHPRSGACGTSLGIVRSAQAFIRWDHRQQTGSSSCEGEEKL